MATAFDVRIDGKTHQQPAEYVKALRYPQQVERNGATTAFGDGGGQELVIPGRCLEGAKSEPRLRIGLHLVFDSGDGFPFWLLEVQGQRVALRLHRGYGN